MTKQNSTLFKLLDDLRGSLQAEDAIRLIYLIKAWKVLSEENKISDKDLTFEAFYNSKITIAKLKDTLLKLSKEHYLFSLSTPLNSARNKMTEEALIMLLNVIQSSEAFIEVGEMIYSLRDWGYDYSVSLQVAELGIKLLGDTCPEIYSPFSNSHVITYFTNKKVYAESLADEFIVEVSKIIDHQNIEFHYTDALEKLSYINPDAPHLLKQFDCTLSFPPLGHNLKSDFYRNDSFGRFKIYNGRGNGDVAYFEHIIAQTKGKAVVLMPVGFCYRAGVELEFRKYLVSNNLLEAVIQLPPNLHNGTAIETTFFIVNKNKDNDDIQFINLNQDEFLQKHKRRIAFNDLSEIVDIYLDKKEIENTSVLVQNSYVADSTYSLSIDRYVISKEAAQLKETLALYNMLELQEVAEIRRSQMFKDEGEGVEVIELSPSDVMEAGYTYESSKSKKIGSQENKLNTYELQPYDVILSTKGTIGKVGIVGNITKPMIASQAMQVIRLNKNSPIDPIVLYMYLKSDIGQGLLRQLVAGVAMPQIATREIKEFRVPLLSEDEMNRIVESFNDEIKLYQEIEEKRKAISNIHNNFLGKNNGN